MTYLHSKITQALTRLTKKKVGMKEAAILFACVDGALTSQLCTLMGEDKDTVKGRMNVLKKKQLISGSYKRDGFVVYRPTAKGTQIIKSTLGIQ